MNKQKEKPYGFWNWGTGIAIAIGLGVLGILYIVYLTTTMDTNMVEDDYYGQELVQNKKITALQNAHKLSAPIKIATTNDAIIIQFPKETVNNIDSGAILFYRASDIKLDVKSPITLNDDGIMVISNKSFKKGLYSFQADWTMNQLDYRVEQTFNF